VTKKEAIKQALERMDEAGRPSHYVIVKDRNTDDYDWIPAAYLDDISYIGPRYVVEHLYREYDPIKVLAGKRRGSRYEAVLSLAQQVEAASTYGDPDNSLVDWLSAGEYTGNETVESITVEWDERD